MITDDTVQKMIRQAYLSSHRSVTISRKDLKDLTAAYKNAVNPLHGRTSFFPEWMPPAWLLITVCALSVLAGWSLHGG